MGKKICHQVRSFLSKVLSFCAILISFRIVVIFAEIETKSAKMITFLKEMRIAQNDNTFEINERTLYVLPIEFNNQLQNY